MKIKSQSGSILLSTLSFIILLAVAAASILELTMNSYKLTMRNELRVQAREVAESELESIYFQFVTKILADLPANTTPTLLSGIAETTVREDIAPVYPTTPRHPFLAVHDAQGWVVKRSISYNPLYDYFNGIIPGSTKYGKVTYITVKIEVQPSPSNYFRNNMVVRVGRRFASSNSSIFQYGVFFQGDMELAPGGNIIINGPVAANGSIYAGAQSGGSLTFQDKVRYITGDYFDKDSLGNVVLRKPGTLVSGGSLVPPTFSIGQLQQLEEQSEPENLVGGVDVNELVSRRPDLFPTENDVYRSAILPPPTPGDHAEYPAYDTLQGDDPTINAQRMYTRSGVIVTINTNGTVTVAKADGTDLTASYASILVGAANTALFDAREARNIAVTTIDVGALKTALESSFSPGPTDFNGSIYFNVMSSSVTTPRGIRLTNGATVFSRSGNGLTVTTNGGVYVQGNYNTTLASTLPNTVPASNPPVSIVPAMIMGDQVTVLSSGWVDSNAVLDKTHRVASGNITIQAGILTGNTSSSSTVASGGVQSLVRYLEMWGGKNVLFLGSLGRLFESKTFTAAWNQPGLADVYGSPLSRTFTFDTLLRDTPPAGSPTTTAFSRGSFFVW